ncbi:pyridoxamine 5'-phosphate oxidase family protein [Pseudalkalibacillus caeni]|uniref:Pyridoxamine 5'-phosphate oxidase n=1 Tax=Exobacillus caeni TaxID=2574798 RepID=A0A5R9F653_9BACL|nr:pyridoxamine 5'-phosphate oxidase family protein [Pseudalkalibacillus caeni]TLS37108.1 pyridoxamine 5'-phosphate oxidase [Pseudalkalibacillus caeni]
MSKKQNKLSPELVQFLQGERIVSLITQDEEQQPHLSTVSWLLADKNGGSVRIAVGHKAGSVKNIQSNPKIILGVIGSGSSYSICGSATVSEVIHGTMKYRVIDVTVEEVKENIFYGGKVVQNTAFVKTYNAELAEKLDQEVYGLLKRELEHSFR